MNENASVKVSVVDYGVCNVGSMVNMLRKLGCTAEIASDPDDIMRASRLILPGVGAFDHGVTALRERGLRDALLAKMNTDAVPLLGVCLGMQLLCEGSEEGDLPGLGLIRGICRRFSFEEASPFRVPHMGWNEIIVSRPSPLMSSLETRARFYFTHSFHLVCTEPTDLLATANHGYLFTAAVQKESVVGVQFHPEKSHRFGMALLSNFSTWNA